MASLAPSSPRKEDMDIGVPFLSEPNQFVSQHEHASTETQDDSQSASLDVIRRRVLITLIVVVFGIESGEQMIPGPMTRIIESIVCRRHLEIHDPSRIPSSGQVAEELCKVPEVQATVAIIKGYSDFFQGLSSTLLSIPFGLLADRYGRKRAIRLTFPGFIMNAIITNTVLWFPDKFPLQALWLAAFSWILGGGPTVVMTVLWTMAADISTDEQRTTIYTRILVGSLVADFASKLISSSLMPLDPWIPMLIGCGVLFFALSCTFLLPETLGLVPGQAKMGRLVSTASTNIEVTPRFLSRTRRKQLRLDCFLDKFWRLVFPFRFMFNFQLALLLSTFFIYQFSQSSILFLAQYISTRFNWSLASANLVVSLQPAINIPIFLFGVPYLSNQHLFKLPPHLKDQYLARVSSVCLALGALGVSLAPSIIILIPSLLLQAAGSGFVFIIRSMVTGLVQREQTARLYIAIQVLQSVGGVAGILSFTNIFAIGLKLSGLWIGLGFIVSAVLFVALVIIVWMRELTKGVGERSEGGIELL